VRVDILERLADLIRPAVTYRPGVTPGSPPSGAADGDGFVVTVAMTSLAGCAGESFASILRALGYAPMQRKGPAITVPLLATAPTVPLETSEVAPSPEPVGAGEALAEPEVAEAEEASAPIASANEPEPASAPEPLPAPETENQVQPEPVIEDHAPCAEASAEMPETAVPEAAPDSSDAPPAAETVEEPLIEVWKPQRLHHQGRRSQETRARRRFPERKNAPGPSAGQAAASTEGSGEVRAAAAQAPHRGRDSKPSGEGRRGWERGQAPSGETRPRPDTPRDRHNGRTAAPRNDENRQGSRKAQDRPPDPNSPFAKLLVLKARLEEKDKQNH
jgi:ATP-dependent RNA helicase SUPV3L1/SUV3